MQPIIQGSTALHVAYDDYIFMSLFGQSRNVFTTHNIKGVLDLTLYEKG